jgi:type I restriction enzyme, S subunit
MKYPMAILSDCCEFLDHRRRPVKESERISGPYPYFGANGQQGWIDDYLFDEPLVLLAEDGGHFSSPERGIAYKISGKTWVNNHAHVLRPIEGVITVDYLSHALRNKDVRRHLSGSTRDKLTKAGACQIEISLPPLEEQRRIAAILDKASQILIASRKADELRQYLLERVFTSMFGDPRENPVGWPKLAIEELTSDYVGGAALVPEDFEDEGVPVLHKGAIKPGGRIEADSRKKGFVSHQTAQHYQQCLAGPDRIAVTLRDLVPSGPFIGLMADLSTTGVPEYLLAQGAYAFKVDARRLLPNYLIALANMPTFRLVLRQNAVGSTQIHIRLPIFKSIEIPVPPIESQLEFAQVIDHISSLNTLSRRQVHHVDELTRSLHGSYF